MKQKKNHSKHVGSSLLQLITMGMHDDPLIIYREYLQNSMDALNQTGRPTSGAVHIDLNPTERRITIRDDGSGLTNSEARSRLLSIGQSDKTLERDRGFRGVGRLCALTFAESVRFRTRSRATEPVVEIVWSKPALQAAIQNHQTVEEAIAQATKTKQVSIENAPTHFFEVQIEGVARYAASTALNQVAVHDYIADVCPVPLGENWTYRNEVEALAPAGLWNNTLEVTLQGEKHPIRRRLSDELEITKYKKDQIQSLELVHITSNDGRSALKGWIAHTSYIGAIAVDRGYRGIRVRAGNIQIGTDSVFDHLFKESRFNRWCIGELHVMDPRLVPNGKREYFEQGPHIRHLENQLRPLFKKLSNRCRNASTKRKRLQTLWREAENAVAFYLIAYHGYVSHDDAARAKSNAEQTLSEIRRVLADENYADRANFKKIEDLQEQLSARRNIRTTRKIHNVSNSQAKGYRAMLKVLIAYTGCVEKAKQLVDQAIRLAEDK